MVVVREGENIEREDVKVVSWREVVELQEKGGAEVRSTYRLSGQKGKEGIRYWTRGKSGNGV